MRAAPLCVLAVLALAAIPARARRETAREPDPPPRVAAAAANARRAAPACRHRSLAGRCLPPPRCAVDELDLEGLCVPTHLDGPGDDPVSIATNSHVDRAGRLVVYDHIPRRPDLPEDYNAYEYPVPPWHGRTVSSGYDLGLPDALQRRGAEMNVVGHGGVDLPHERGTPVHVVALRGEVGEAEVLYVGPLWGNTVVLRHLVRDGAAMRSYVAVHAHLDAAAPGLVRGQSVAPGTLIGFVGDTASIGMVHLHYETRLVRPGIDPMRVEPPAEVVAQTVSVPCDPRNLLPLRPRATAP